MVNEWTVTHGTHEIHVVKTPTGGAHLYVDDELVDATNDLYAAEDDPALVGVFGDDVRVDVFLTPASLAAIRINGQWVTGGGLVYAVASD
jgi:hypothetical protein